MRYLLDDDDFDINTWLQQVVVRDFGIFAGTRELYEMTHDELLSYLQGERTKDIERRQTKLKLVKDEVDRINIKSNEDWEKEYNEELTEDETRRDDQVKRNTMLKERYHENIQKITTAIETATDDMSLKMLSSAKEQLEDDVLAIKRGEEGLEAHRFKNVFPNWEYYKQSNIDIAKNNLVREITESTKRSNQNELDQHIEWYKRFVRDMNSTFGQKND